MFCVHGNIYNELLPPSPAEYNKLKTAEYQQIDDNQDRKEYLFNIAISQQQYKEETNATLDGKINSKMRPLPSLM